MALTEKQQRFCDFYIISGNAKQAAVEAGYSPKTAYSIGNENLNKPDLKTYIAEQLEKMHNKRTADGQEVLEYLTAVMRGEQTEQTLVGLGEGAQGVTEIEVGAKDRLKAAELLGKRHALFTDKKEITGEVGVTFVDDVPTED
ncbi:terminase small subunit [Enterococcus sp. BWB1-3]|uniref:terminase small subunit n=1 Tax=Enterococcus sp. BWB1-3 TaxID=2787713 RepID=UPI0019247B89|nr:terminase small subunit [Enterococcus sp. BWB1-3]MBL1228754.1 terminase small subunit [Enterococcus sp. BWB1-3]